MEACARARALLTCVSVAVRHMVRSLLYVGSVWSEYKVYKSLAPSLFWK